MKRQRPPKNFAERTCYEALIRDGWEPTKRGWPDFLAFKDGECVVVEVKPQVSHPLKDSQKRVIGLLVKHGIKCLRFSPDDGFTQLFSAQSPLEMARS